MPSRSLGGDTPTKRDPSAKLQPVPLESLGWAGEPWDEERKVGRFEYVDERPAYVRDQVIVTGREDDVKPIVSEVLGKAETLRDPIDLGEILPADALERFPGQGRVIIGLYSTGDLSVRDAVVRIHKQAAGSQKAVFAHPNYVTGHPHIPAGSPHIPAGSPHIPAGSPEDLPVAAQADFWKQWAFAGQWGIGLTTLEGVRLDSLINHKGTGVRVAIFDTSPFSSPGPQEIHWITPELALNVSHLLGSAHTTGPTADHGLFAAGLVHAVAPESQIELIQVLNEEALGDLDTLNDALAEFMLQRMASNAGTLSNTVMNLSLGFPEPSNLADLSLEVVSLGALLLGAKWMGATVVAAAGNASSPSGVQPAEVPAAYNSVIGAMASTRSGGRACFSNQGDVVAPGGDSNVTADTCAEELTDICDFGLISLVLNTDALPPDGPSGYGCWAGTSFSAPLVSGLAALLLESQGLPPSAIEPAGIKAGARIVPTSGLHIINVPGSLGLP